MSGLHDLVAWGVSLAPAPAGPATLEATSRYLLLAYVVGLGTLWGYALMLWRSSRALRRRSVSGQRI